MGRVRVSQRKGSAWSISYRASYHNYYKVQVYNLYFYATFDDKEEFSVNVLISDFQFSALSFISWNIFY